MTLAGKPRIERVGPIEQETAAPVPLVHQMLGGGVGQGKHRPGEGAAIVERDGNRLVADFRTSVPVAFGRVRVVRTREAVMLCRPTASTMSTWTGRCVGSASRSGSRRSPNGAVALRTARPACRAAAGGASRLASWHDVPSSGRWRSVSRI